MSDTPLFAAPTTFAAVQADTLRLLAQNPRVAYSLTPALMTALTRAVQVLESTPASAEDSVYAERVSDVNAAVARLRSLERDAGVPLTGFVTFSPDFPQGARSILLPARASTLRGTTRDNSYVYDVDQRDGLLSAEVVASIFGGVSREELRFEGVGRQALLTVLAQVGPCHVSIGGATREPLSDDDVPIFEGAWVATRDRVYVPRVYTQLSGQLFDTLSDRGRINAYAQPGDTIGSADVRSVVGQHLKLSAPIAAGGYALRPAGSVAWRALADALSPISLPATRARRQQMLTEAGALRARCDRTATRTFWSPSASADIQVVTRAHAAVGADYAMSVFVSGDIAAYRALDETTASYHATMNHVVNRALTLEL